MAQNWWVGWIGQCIKRKRAYTACVHHKGIAYEASIRYELNEQATSYRSELVGVYTMLGITKSVNLEK